jgi:colanic acid biosynthesis glycosyl transferase WcaI
MSTDVQHPAPPCASRTSIILGNGSFLRVLIYGLNYAPELTGIGKYTGEMAEWLAERGHDVRVITAPPYYPAWRVWDNYRRWWYVKETSPGRPTVYRVPLWVPKRLTGLTRLLHLVSFAFFSFPMALLQTMWEPEVVFTIEPTFFSAPLAWVVAQLGGARCWLHVQDFEVDAAFELGFLPADGPGHSLAVWTEEWFTAHFDRVSSISPRMLARSISKGVPPEKAVLFPNWVDTDAVRPGTRDTDFRRDLELGEKIVVLYSGNMGGKQGLGILSPLAAACASDDNIHFLFCGDGAFRPLLEEQVGGLSNVTLLPLQPIEKLNDLLNTADIHLLPQRAGAADLVMPSKLTGMLSSGRSVIATADPGTQVATVVENCGVVVPPEEIEPLVAAVRALAADPERRQQMGERAREYAVAHLGRERVLEQFERDLSWVLRAGRRASRRPSPR